jgi:hypothetical protein
VLINCLGKKIKLLNVVIRAKKDNKNCLITKFEIEININSHYQEFLKYQLSFVPLRQDIHGFL